MYKRLDPLLSVSSPTSKDNNDNKNDITSRALVVSSTSLVPSPPKKKQESSQQLVVNQSSSHTTHNKSLSYPRSRLDFIYSLEKEASTKQHQTSSSNRLTHFDPKTGGQLAMSPSQHHHELSSPISARSSSTKNHLQQQQNNNNTNTTRRHSPSSVVREAVLSIGEGDPSFVHRSRGKILPPLAVELSSFVRRENTRIEKDMQQLLTMNTSSINNLTNSSSLIVANNNKNSNMKKKESENKMIVVMKERLTTVRETLNCLGNHFPDYNEVFGQMLIALDESLLETTETQKKFSELELFRNSSDSIIEQKIHEVKDFFQRKFEKLKHHDLEQQRKIQQLSEEVEKLTGDCNFHNRRLTEKVREFEQSESRAQMFRKAMEEETHRSIELTKRLARLTATNKQLQSNVDFMDRLLKDAEHQIEKAKKEEDQKQRSLTSINGDDENKSDEDDTDEESNDNDDNKNQDDNDDDYDPNEPISRKMDDAVLSQLTHWKEKLFHLDVKVKRLASINNELMDDKKRLLERIELMKSNMASQDDALTPRPNWLRVNEVFPRFSLNAAASSDETLDDVLLVCEQELHSVRHEAEARIMGNVVSDFLGEENLCESDLVRSTKHFIARGTGPHVPVYLRATGVIKNRRMRKFGAEAVLKKFWNARRKQLGIPAPSVTKLLNVAQGMMTNRKGDGPAKNDDDNNTKLGKNTKKMNKVKHLYLLHTNIYQNLQNVLHARNHQQHESKTKNNNNNNSTATDDNNNNDYSPTAFDHGAYYAGGKATKTPIDYFFIEFLTELTGTTKLGVELAYNLLAICEQFQSDADCSAILRVLKGEISEFIIYDQMDMLVKLEAALHSVDISKKGKLSRSTIHRVLHLMFPAKTKEDMLRVRLNLAISCGGDQMVDIVALFKEDEEANQSRFVETLRSQHLEEALLFGVEVEEALRETTRMNHHNHLQNNNEQSSSPSSTENTLHNHSLSSDFIDASLAKAALHAIDPAMPDYIVSEIIAAGCNLKSGKDLNEMLAARLELKQQQVHSHSQQSLTSMTNFPIQPQQPSPSSLCYPVEPFLERIRRNVLVKRYGKSIPDDVIIGVGGGDNNNDALLQRVLSASSKNAMKASDDDDEQFFKFMMNIQSSSSDDDDDEDDEEEVEEEIEEEEENTDDQQSGEQKMMKKKIITIKKTKKSIKNKREPSSNPPQPPAAESSARRRRKSLAAFVRTTANDGGTGGAGRARKSLYQESQIDKLLEDESDFENDDSDDEDDSQQQQEESKKLSKQPSFAKILQRANSKSAGGFSRDDFQRKVELGEASTTSTEMFAGSNMNGSTISKKPRSRLSSMTNVVTAAVAAENFRRMFQQSQAEKDAMRRSQNNPNNSNQQQQQQKPSDSIRRKSLVSIL